jgi:hypothetical protein
MNTWKAIINKADKRILKMAVDGVELTSQDTLIELEFERMSANDLLLNTYKLSMKVLGKSIKDLSPFGISFYGYHQEQQMEQPPTTTLNMFSSQPMVYESLDSDMELMQFNTSHSDYNIAHL